MPKFVGIYRQDEMLGKPWSSSLLKTHISHLASKGQLCIEKEAGQQNEIATRICFVKTTAMRHHMGPTTKADTNTNKATTGTKRPSLVMAGLGMTP